MLIHATGSGLDAACASAEPEVRSSHRLVRDQVHRMERAYQRLLLAVTLPVIALVAALAVWQYALERDALDNALLRTLHAARATLDAAIAEAGPAARAEVTAPHFAALEAVQPVVGTMLLQDEGGRVLAAAGADEADADAIAATPLRVPLRGAPWTLVHVGNDGIVGYFLPRMAPYGAILCALVAATLVAHWMTLRRFVHPSLRLLHHLQAEAEGKAGPPPDLPRLWQPWVLLVSAAFDANRTYQRRLEETEARFLAAVDSMPDGLAIFDRDDRLVFHNRRYPEHLAPSLRSVLALGKRFDDWIREGLAVGPIYHPDMGPDFAEKRIGNRRLTSSAEHEHRIADGRWLRIRESPMADGGRVLLTSDISTAKQAETAIRESELRYRAVVETQHEFVARLTPQGQLTFVNDAYVRQLGGDREAVMSPDWNDFDRIVPEDRARHDAHIAALSPERPDAMIEIRCTVPGGEVRIEQWSDIAIFDEAGRVVEIQCVGRDVTAQRAVEAELARQREALHQSEKLAALGSLLAGVAHELNNPLSIVTGYATMLRDQGGDETTRRRAEAIHTAAERCARIVKSFLAMARSTHRATQPVELNAVVEAALEMLAYGLRTAGVAVETALEHDLPTVLGDADQLHQVVSNLVLNAQQAMLEHDRPRRLKLFTRRDGDDVVLEIADTGPGVPEALKARLFEPFFSTKPVGAGTGLGLSVSRGIVLAHGGTIAVEDGADGGALFRVRLPAADADAPAVVAQDERPGTHSARVLVVDDEPGILAMLRETLEADGHLVTTAGSGREALALVDTAPFDLVLTDLRMPDLDGAALMRMLGDRRPDLLPKIVLMTGDVLGSGLGATVKASAAPLLEKPIDVDALRRLLAERLAANGGRGART